MYSTQPEYKGSICVCGTGGDKSNSFNISTTVSFVVASADVPVIKHGNKSITSNSEVPIYYNNYTFLLRK